MSSLDVVLSYGDYVIRKYDVKILRSTDWLNDTLIGFYLQYLADSENVGNNNLCKFVGPEVTQLLKLLSPEDLVSVLPELISDIQQYQYIFLPVNDCGDPNLPSGGSHWSLLVFSKVDNSFVHFDSSAGYFNDPQAEFLATKLGLFTKSSTFITSPHCLKQLNGYDCGFHVLGNIRVISNYLKMHPKESILQAHCPTINAEDASAMRKQLLNLVCSLSPPANTCVAPT